MVNAIAPPATAEANDLGEGFIVTTNARHQQQQQRMIWREEFMVSVLDYREWFQGMDLSCVQLSHQKQQDQQEQLFDLDA